MYTIGKTENHKQSSLYVGMLCAYKFVSVCRLEDDKLGGILQSLFTLTRSVIGLELTNMLV